MTEFIDIKAFLVTARTGSFSAASREIGVAPSIVTKRVSRLEHRLKTQLFMRSTRKLILTPEAERLRPQLQILSGELEDVLNGANPKEKGMTGELRIKVPTTIGTLYVGPAIAAFQAKHLDIRTTLMLIDRAINPLEEGYDIAFGALPASYAGVTTISLCPYKRALVAAPDYVRRAGSPQTLTDLVHHHNLTYLLSGFVWAFETAKGTVEVDVPSSFAVNDSNVLKSAVEAGAGIAILPRFLATKAIAEGRLVELLPETPPVTLWFKALVPRNRLHRPEVKAMLEYVQKEFDPVPPWERQDLPA